MTCLLEWLKPQTLTKPIYGLDVEQWECSFVAVAHGTSALQFDSFVQNSTKSY